MTRPTLSARSPNQTRESILAAARRQFGERGFHATSVQTIVDEAGVTKGALYHHFESKDEILRLIHDEFIEAELQHARDIVARELPPRDTLALIMESLVDSLDTYLDSIEIFFRERYLLSQDVMAEIRAKRDELEELVVQTLERGVADGSFRPQPSLKVAAFGVIGICAWGYQWYRQGGPMRGREIGRMYASMVLEGLETPGRRTD